MGISIGAGLAKLSHIEDIEQRREQQTARVPEQPPKPEPAPVTEAEAAPRQDNSSAKTQSQLEEDFHGIDVGTPMGVGQKFLIILAVLVTLAALLYIVNSWLHFI